MTKEEFLEELRTALSGIPKEEFDERISFYSEMIDDRMEEGMTEEEAVAGVGTVKEIADQTVSDIPMSKLVVEKIKPQRTLRGWEIVLIVLGFPLWFPLLIAALAVALSVYIVIWSLIIALWAIELSLAASFFAGLAGMVFYFIQSHPITAIASLGVGLLSAGLTIFMFFGCKEATLGILKLTKLVALKIKYSLFRKERSK